MLYEHGKFEAAKCLSLRCHGFATVDYEAETSLAFFRHLLGRPLTLEWMLPIPFD